MRVHFGNRRGRHAAPVNDVPQYYRYHLDNPGADVTIAAWQCPVQVPPGATTEWFERNCTIPMEDVTFTLTDTPVDEEPAAPLAIIPPHFGLGDLRVAARSALNLAPKPYLLCEVASPDNATQPADGSAIRCNWYTWHLQPADITVYAWECPADYDLSTPNADPMSDCIGLASGTRFRLQNTDPAVEMLAYSGAYRMGAARFGDLKAGTYTLTELSATSDESDTILWQCFGLNGDRAQPSRCLGPEMSFSLQGGEHILCHRFRIRHAAKA